LIEKKTKLSTTGIYDFLLPFIAPFGAEDLDFFILKMLPADRLRRVFSLCILSDKKTGNSMPQDKSVFISSASPDSRCDA